jgi:hypothetical protein
MGRSFTQQCQELRQTIRSTANQRLRKKLSNRRHCYDHTGNNKPEGQAAQLLRVVPNKIRDASPQCFDLLRKSDTASNEATKAR